MRMRFRNLAASARPSSQNVSDGMDADAVAHTSLTEIVTSMRGTNSAAEHEDVDEWIVSDTETDFPSAFEVPAESAEPTLKRRSLLKRKTA